MKNDNQKNFNTVFCEIIEIHLFNFFTYFFLSHSFFNISIVNVDEEVNTDIILCIS